MWHFFGLSVHLQLVIRGPHLVAGLSLVTPCDLVFCLKKMEGHEACGVRHTALLRRKLGMAWYH